jgi:hypothetical protein
MKSRYPFYISLDQSAFDQNQDAGLIKVAFDVLKCCFKPGSVDDVQWDAMVDGYINKVYIIPEEWKICDDNGVSLQQGCLLPVHRGTPSGSMWTQIVDSVINRIAILTYFNHLGIKCDMVVMGDDNLCFYDAFEEVDPHDLASYLARNLHLTVNASKSSHGSRFMNPEYLSREWRPSGVWRNPNELIARLLYPERIRIDKTTGEHIPCEYVIYAYYLEFKLGMEEAFDMQKFFGLYPNLNKDVLESVDLGMVSGALKFIHDYGALGAA